MSTIKISDNVFENAWNEGKQVIEYKVSEWLYSNQGQGKPCIISDIDDMDEGVCNNHQMKLLPTKRFGKIEIDYHMCEKCFHGYACIYPLKIGESNE